MNHQLASYFLALGFVLLSLADAQGVTKEPYPLAQLNLEAVVSSELDNVWAQAAPNYTAPLTLSRLSGTMRLSPGGRVTTDERGEAVLDIERCMKIYLFRSSSLVKATCRKSGDRGLCGLAGTAAYNNHCGPAIVIQTPTVEVRLEGTWVALSYLPERQMSVLLVLEGQARVQPVSDLDSGRLGAPTLVRQGFFWFSTPDRLASQNPVSGLRAREAISLDSFPTFYRDMAFPPDWLGRIRDKARQDGIPIPPALGDNSAPTIIWNRFPLGNLRPSEFFTIEVDVSDVGLAGVLTNVAKVEIYVDNRQVQLCTRTNRCRVSLNTSDFAEGRHEVRVEAFDQAGNRSSERAFFNVVARVVAKVNITSQTIDPPEPTTVDKITLLVEAPGADKIEIWLSGRLVASCSDSPCRAQVRPLGEGKYSYEARAYLNGTLMDRQTRPFEVKFVVP